MCEIITHLLKKEKERFPHLLLKDFSPTILQKLNTFHLSNTTYKATYFQQNLRLLAFHKKVSCPKCCLTILSRSYSDLYLSLSNHGTWSLVQYKLCSVPAYIFVTYEALCIKQARSTSQVSTCDWVGDVMPLTHSFYLHLSSTNLSYAGGAGSIWCKRARAVRNLHRAVCLKPSSLGAGAAHTHLCWRELEALLL